MLYTHYDYLELPPGASTTRIEAAYQTLKQRLNGHGDEMMVRLIHEAYAVLSNPEERHVYDASLQQAAAEADAELKACLDERINGRTRYVQDVPAPLRRGDQRMGRLTPSLRQARADARTYDRVAPVRRARSYASQRMRDAMTSARDAGRSCYFRPLFDRPRHWAAQRTPRPQPTVHK